MQYTAHSKSDGYFVPAILLTDLHRQPKPDFFL